MPLASGGPDAHGEEIEFPEAIGSRILPFHLARSRAPNFHDIGAALHQRLSGLSPLRFHLNADAATIFAETCIIGHVSNRRLALPALRGWNRIEHEHGFRNQTDTPRCVRSPARFIASKIISAGGGPLWRTDRILPHHVRCGIPDGQLKWTPSGAGPGQSDAHGDVAWSSTPIASTSISPETVLLSCWPGSRLIRRCRKTGRTIRPMMS